MKKYLTSALLILILSNFSISQETKIRKQVDTIGFASKPEQMDELIERIKLNQDYLWIFSEDIRYRIDYSGYKTVISPHDDYSYVGYLYPFLLNKVKAKTVILFGVCHKAKLFNLENKIIFDSYTHWQMPYGNVKVSSLREEIISGLPPDSYVINDSVQELEHSVEAIVPFLQNNNRDVEIISILIPYMSFDKMSEIAESLAAVVFSAADKKKMEWGEDYAFVISSDAVHYGDQDWGGKNYAPYGTGDSGYTKAVKHDKEIINNCLVGELKIEKIKKFIGYTVDENNFREYKWTWCGRYSVPFGLLTSFYLRNLSGKKLSGEYLGFGYATSLDHSHIPVDDLGMGTTAPANIRHWVGYPAIGYR